MNKKTKALIISHLPLPYHKIGSWTNMYDHNLRRSDTPYNGIICPKPKLPYHNQVEYAFFKKPVFYRIKSKLLKNRYFNILDVLSSYIKHEPECNHVIQVIDNFGILKALLSFRTKNKLQNKIYIQYFYHGFLLPKNAQTEFILSQVDEYILLTHLSLKVHETHYSILPKNRSFIHNGIDKKLFNTHNRIENKNKTIFLWCSRDRPKKGLHIILKIWKKFHDNHKNTELWIIGNEQFITGNGINSFGGVKNQKLPEIYKQADVYLFPTLYEEGFGLTLAEAMHCGCFCIASNLGSIPEVLNFGEYGWLVDEPQNPGRWFEAMTKYINNKPETPEIPKSLYSLDTWSLNMKNIISDAKKRLEQKKL